MRWRPCSTAELAQVAALYLFTDGETLPFLILLCLLIVLLLYANGPSTTGDICHPRLLAVPV